MSWSKSDGNAPNNLIENITEENDNAKQEADSEICVSIKDATFAWPNSKVPVLAVDKLKIEEGVVFFIYFVRPFIRKANAGFQVN